MNFRASLMFAKSLIFPRYTLNSTARKSVLAAIVCVGLSLIPLVVVHSVSEGMIAGMTERIIGLGSGHLQTYLRRSSDEVENLSNFYDFADSLAKVKGVTEVYPQVDCDGLAAGKSYRTGTKIRAVPSDIFAKNEDFVRLFDVEAGDPLLLGKGKRNAVIGAKLAELLNLKNGDTFRLITTKTGANGMIIPNAGVFKVCGIVSSGYQELDALWCFIPLESGFTYIPNKSANYSVLIKTQDPFSAELENIRQNCNSIARGCGVTFDWKQLNESQFENFSSTKVLLLFVMALIVAVSAVNISSALVMLVMERKKEIAILKCIGGTKKGISFSFILTGIFCAFAGSLIGFPVGIILSLNANGLIHIIEVIVNFFAKLFFVMGGGNLEAFSAVKLLDPAFYLTEISVSIPWGQLFIMWVLVMLLSLVASLVPAINAGKKEPLDIFRKA